MDPHSATIDQDVAFGFDGKTASLTFQAPVQEEPLDAAAPDFDLCRLGLPIMLSGFVVCAMTSSVGKRTKISKDRTAKQLARR